MFLKIIKLNKYLFKRTDLRFCSQMTKISDNLTESSKQKESEKCEEKSVSKKEKFEIEKVVKSEEFMDKIWEINQTYDHKTEYHKITDPYFEAHYRLNNIIDRIINRGIFTKIGYTYKEKAKDWVKYREENQQKYVARRHAKLGPDLAVANFVVVRGGRVRFKRQFISNNIIIILKFIINFKINQKIVRRFGPRIWITFLTNMTRDIN